MPRLSVLTLLIAFLLSTGIPSGIKTKACVQEQIAGHAVSLSSMCHTAAMLSAAPAKSFAHILLLTGLSGSFADVPFQRAMYTLPGCRLLSSHD